MSYSSMEARRAGLLEDLIHCVAKGLRDLGIPADPADQLSLQLVDHVAEHWGGQTILIPVDQSVRLSKRDMAIWRDHEDGASLAELCQRYGVTRWNLQRVLRRYRRRNAVDAQMALVLPPQVD